MSMSTEKDNLIPTPNVMPATEPISQFSAHDGDAARSETLSSK